MAFTSRIGNVLRTTSVPSSLPLLQAVRCMSSSKLFVAGLPYAIDDTTLRNEFSRYGDLLEARIITDRESGCSRGFGFVTYTSSEEASAAITALDGKVVRDKRTGKTKGYGFVSFSNPTDLAAAIKEMNGKYVGNRPIKLRKSNWKERTDVEALERQKNHVQRKPKMPKKSILHK